VLLAVSVAVVARLSTAQIGGQTGDVLGALEQVGEILVLLVAVA
jgi:adenosylcobinamide-GDP ribazoletransferase